MVKLYWYEGFTDNLDRRLSFPQPVGFSAGVQLSGIFVLPVEFQSSSVDAVDMPETDGRGRSRAGGWNRPRQPAEKRSVRRQSLRDKIDGLSYGRFPAHFDPNVPGCRSKPNDPAVPSPLRNRRALYRSNIAR